MLPINLQLRLFIASGDKFGSFSRDGTRMAHDELVYAWDRQLISIYTNETVSQTDGTDLQVRKRRMNIGIISYDFNDHPTSHMIVGLLQLLKSKHLPYVPILTAEG